MGPHTKTDVTTDSACFPSNCLCDCDGCVGDGKERYINVCTGKYIKKKITP
jgi:hypothetical protein